MKKIPSALILITSFLISSNTLADDYYASANVKVGKIKMTLSDAAPITSRTSKSTTPLGFDVAGGMYLHPNIRAEISLGFMAATGAKFDDPSALIPDLKARFKQFSGMANFYFDMHLADKITPNIMAGIGYSRSSVKIKGTNVNTIFNKVTNGKGGVSWQLGAGIDYIFSDAAKGVLAYRIQDTGYRNGAFAYTNPKAGGPTSMKITAKTAQLLNLGLRIEY